MTEPLRVIVTPGPVPWVPCDLHPRGVRPPAMFTVTAAHIGEGFLNVCNQHLFGAVVTGLSADGVNMAPDGG